MRVHRLEITGIGPFRHTQVIDFDRLTESGLFLIDGPTGAGKTTIIDSIVFALFSGLSGEGSSKERIRSDHALPLEKSEVILDFSVQGRMHKITRSPAYTAAKTHGEGFTNKPAKQSLIEYSADGTERLTLTSAADIGAHVTRLLNLNAQQFRQLVVLAQGEFAALLRMKPRERLESLRGLLGTQYYQDLQTAIAEQGQRSRETLASARSKLATIATTAQAFKSADNQEVLTPFFELLESEDSTSEQRRDAWDAILDHFTLENQTISEEVRVAEEEWEPVKARLTEVTASLDAFMGIESARQDVEAAREHLEPGDREITATVAAALIHELTLRAGALQPLAQWESRAQQRVAQRDQLVALVEQAEREHTDFTEELEKLPQRLTDIDLSIGTRNAQLNELEVLQTQKSAVDSLLEKVDALTVAQVEDADAAETLRVAQAELHAHTLEREKAQRAVTGLVNRQLEQRVAVLAAQLAPGEPCAVCGAVEHPQPAPAPDTEAVVTEADVQAAEKLVTALDAQISRAQQDVETARTEASETATTVATLRGALGSHTSEQLASSTSELTETINALNAELACTEDLDEQRERLIRQQKDGAATLERLQGERTSARTELDVHDREVDNQNSTIRDLVGAEGSATEELAAVLVRAQLVKDYSSALATLAQRESTVTNSEAKIEELHKEHAEVTERNTYLSDHLTAISAALAVSNATLDSVRQLHTNYRDQLAVNEELESKHGTAIRLAAIVTAQSAQNTKKLPLESYALQLRFGHVLEAASIHLEKMSSGRLSFVLDQGSQSNAQAGLGIDVMDSWTGESRDPASLSGGETFYASLALALGLADVVHAETGGVSLETLFVDEGFGSLDQETLQVVLDQLENLKSGGRVIGVISHVSEMKDRFPERLVVTPQSDGTSVVRQEISV